MNLKQLRLAAGITQFEAVQYLKNAVGKMSISTLNHWERGSKVSTEYVEPLAEVYKCTILDVLNAVKLTRKRA